MSLTDFLLICGNLKKTKRTGWLNNGISNCESIADHMYRMALIAMLITDPRINKEKLVKMALVHDLAEAIVGDITPFDGISNKEKHKREMDAIDIFVETLESSATALEIKSLWCEYETGTSKEAKVCKDIDKYEMILQAFEYEKEHRINLDSFFESTRNKFNHDEIITLVEELYLLRKTNQSQDPNMTI